MATGFDRLERLFSSKRKASLASIRVVTSTSPPTEPQFPSPSFIRPTATRMTAREEVCSRLATGRSPSVPDAIPSRLGSLSSNASSPGFGRSPIRSPSLSDPHSQPDSLVAKLREYRFSPPSPEEKAVTGSVAFSPAGTEQFDIPSPRSQTPPRLPDLTRLHTPPSPRSADTGTCRRSLESLKSPTLTYNAPPTPEDSPEIVPVRNLLADSKIFDIAIDKTLFDEIEDQLLQSFDHASFNDSYNDSSSSETSSNSSTLREPDFNEFLNLSDDDIAEMTPEDPTTDSDDESQKFSPSSMDTSAPSPTPAAPSSLLTLTPPPASRPATAAAFEAARIAKRHDFDLIYVVNLWPGGPCGQMFDLGSTNTCERPLVGRLLAAHGLHQVPSPLQISSVVHTTILRSKGWVEYRNQEAESHELARGYACSFYPGKFSQGSSSGKESPVSGVRLSDKIDRGIVFAAYRKPRIGPCKLGHSFTGSELNTLHEDAETLVEMLIDIHARNRQCRTASHHQVCDDTGPMPMQQTAWLSA
ncbi:MFS permease [Trichoderma parareesei]|uniref:MFS permease n=1 Tax=Trichoderma parareesei TaxID=858221 RepID=A0A2H2ZU34_TRIPA|nr:MFS permease [Trichoderma parareesei]